MRRKFIVTAMTLSIVALLVTSCGKGITGQVVCFGDSITYGALVDGHSWVWYLSKEHPAVDFVNAGRSGRKTSDREELPPVLEKYPDADYYLIFLGVNDLKDGTDAMVHDCVQNMRWMITQIRGSNPDAHIVILAPTDINLQTMSDINVQKKYNQNTKESLRDLARQYQALAREENTKFLSLLHTVSPPNYVDGLHPDEAGQQQIAEAVWQGLNRPYQ